MALYWHHMNKHVPWKVLVGGGVLLAVFLGIIGAGGTLGQVLWGTAILFIILGVVAFFNVKGK